jgi:uncharacterized protein (DUF1015 family)
MPRVFPFEGLTYDEGVAGPLDRLTTPPYDVISGDRRGAALSASPFNIVHVDLAEGSSDSAVPGNRYERAATTLSEWRSEGVLTRAPQERFYAYEVAFELHDEPRRLRGIVCAMELEPWGGSVLPHEEVMAGPVQDRLSLLRATATHLSAVYGTVTGPCPRLADLLDAVCAAPAAQRIVDEEGVTHSMWPVEGQAAVGRWLSEESLLIADGHHRYTTALAYREEMRTVRGAGPWDRIMTLVVDAGSQDVPVLPYHRIQLAGEPPKGGEPVEDLHGVLDAVDDDRLRLGTVVMRDETPSYRMHDLAGEPPTVCALHAGSLDHIAPGDHLAFTHDAEDADRAVRRGEALAAYFLPSTTPDRIRKVVERGERLPRKSTFFWPKPRTGMVLMPLDG